MIVYHGSDHCFKTLKVSERLRDKESTSTNEGIGIYFSTNIDVAKSYGKYLYTIEVDDDAIIDFTKKEVCRDYLYTIKKNIYKLYDIDISRYFDLEMLIDRMYLGGQCIFNLAKEIELNLDSNEYWYLITSESKRQAVYRYLRTYNKKHLKAYTFAYHIKNIGVIKREGLTNARIIERASNY